MARHLQTVTDKEWDDLLRRVVEWLKAYNVAGSIAEDYSIYNALDDERERAQKASADDHR